MDKRPEKLVNSDVIKGSWSAFHQKRPNGYTYDDAEIIKRDIRGEMTGDDLPPYILEVNSASDAILSGYVSEASRMLMDTPWPAKFYMPGDSRNDSMNAMFEITDEGIPYCFISWHYLRLAEFSPTYREKLMLHLVGHEVQHGNQPDLHEIMGLSCQYSEPMEKARSLLSYTTSLTSPTLAVSFLKLTDKAHKYSRGRLKRKIHHIKEYDSDMAIARANGDFRGAMEELVLSGLYSIQKEDEVLSLRALRRAFSLKMHGPSGKEHPNDFDRIRRLGKEEFEAGAVPMGAEPLKKREKVESWVDVYIKKVYGEATSAAVKVGACM